MDRKAYEYLVTLNHNFEEIVDVLKKLAIYPELNNDVFLIQQAYLQEHLANANADVLHTLAGLEEKAGGLFYKERRAFEKRARDPDDCYLDVLHREEERRQQGLPSLIGIQRGMRRATREEALQEILEGREPMQSTNEQNVESDDGDGDRENEGKRVDQGGRAGMSKKTDSELYRDKVVERVEILRIAMLLPKLDLYQQIGPVASREWTNFVQASGAEAWKHISHYAFYRITQVLETDYNQLMRFES